MVVATREIFQIFINQTNIKILQININDGFVMICMISVRKDTAIVSRIPKKPIG